MVSGATKRAEADRRREMKTGRVSVVFGAVGLVLAALLAVVDLRAALSVALLPSFLLSLGSRLVFAGRRPAVVWVLDLLGLVLMLAMVGSILERIADAR
ncbi:MAG: hypothetical protein H0U10_07135 [Chloroflexia bacterium]|nr:hypothetical protein [Chloroflexia bacterium]